MPHPDLILPVLLGIFAVAVLYAAVGHGGASGYLAVMALAGFAPAVLRPTALTLNLVVSLMGTLLFLRAGKFQLHLFLPLIAASIPFAYLGGTIQLPSAHFHVLLGIALAFAAIRLVLPMREGNEKQTAPLVGLLALGACIGLLSGLVGVGGGIFLTPILIFLHWSDTRQAAALSAPFIFVNSICGLIGQGTPWQNFPAIMPWMIAGVILGGVIGASWGSGYARLPQLRLVLAAVLSVACLKLFVI
jgi:uncharacterized membrane protein YfcA